MAEITFDDLIPAQSGISFDDLIPGSSNSDDQKAAFSVPGRTMRGKADAGGQDMQGARDVARQVAEGASLGFADKGLAAAQTLTGPGNYTDNLAAQRAQTEAFAQQHPVAAAGLRLGGGLLTGVGAVGSGLTALPRAMAATLPLRAGIMGAEGAAYGAASGVGHTDTGNAGDIARNVRDNASLGFGLGAVTPAVGAAAGVAYRAAAPMLSNAVEGMSRPASRFLEYGLNADSGAVANVNKLGSQAMLADAGPSMQGLAQGVATRPGEGKTALVDAIEARQAGRNARLGADANANLGAAESPVGKTKELLDARKAITSPMYDQALNSAPPVDTSGVLATIGSRLNSAEGSEKLALMKARNMLLEQTQAGPIPKTDANRLHNIKQELNTMIEYGDPGLGVPAGALNRSQGAAKEVRRALNSALESDVPGYAAANAKSAEYARYAENVEKGTKVLGGGESPIWPSDLSQQMGSMTPAEQAALRAGVRGNIEARVGTQANDLAALKKTIGGEGDFNREKMAMVFGDQPTQRMIDAVAREQAFSDTANKVAGNSQTAPRAAAEKMLETPSVPNVPVNATMFGSASRGAQWLAQQALGMRHDNVREELGRALSMQGSDRDFLIAQLMDAMKRRQGRASTVQGLLSGPSVPAGLLGAYDPSSRR